MATFMSIFDDYDCCTILRISESILGLDFNQMSDDAELL